MSAPVKFTEMSPATADAVVAVLQSAGLGRGDWFRAYRDAWGDREPSWPTNGADLVTFLDLDEAMYEAWERANDAT